MAACSYDECSICYGVGGEYEGIASLDTSLVGAVWEGLFASHRRCHAPRYAYRGSIPCLPEADCRSK